MMDRRELLKVMGGAALIGSTPYLTVRAAEDGIIELRAQKTKHLLAGGKYKSSDLWLYNGKTPGPEIRVKKGARVRVRFINELDEGTSIHWHGIRVDNAMDGVSHLTQDPVPPGGTFLYDFIVPDAGTFWYHAHNKSWKQVARGLYGALIVEELNASFDKDHDITLVIDDWRLANDGSLQVSSLGAFMDWTHAGRLGNWVTTNGQSKPNFQLNTNENYRLRLINASNARVLQINPKKMGAKILGYDGFDFEAPREAPEFVELTPAQRVDLAVSSPDRSSKTIREVGGFALEVLAGRDAVEIASFKFNKGPNKNLAPIKLTPNTSPALDIHNAKHFSLFMTGGAMGRMGEAIYNGKPLTNEVIQRDKQVWAFNGVANLAKDPFFQIKRGETVVITTDNQTGWLHGMHVHGHHFKIIERNGKPIKQTDWRDTFRIDRGETVAITFVANNPGKWLLHCHMLEHAAAGMNTWFEVV